MTKFIYYINKMVATLGFTFSGSNSLFRLLKKARRVIRLASKKKIISLVRMADKKNFKSINFNFATPLVDSVLARVSKTLKRIRRKGKLATKKMSDAVNRLKDKVKARLSLIVNKPLNFLQDKWLYCVDVLKKHNEVARLTLEKNAASSTAQLDILINDTGRESKQSLWQKFFEKANWVRFGLFYLFFVYCFFLAYFYMPSSKLLNRDTFGCFVVLELGIFITIFICFLYFFGVIKKHTRPAHLSRELRALFVSNLISIFAVYAALLLLNYIVYYDVTILTRVTKFLFFFGINLHSQDYALLLIKFAYLVLGILSLHMTGKYFINGKVQFQYVVLIALSVWGGLFFMNIDNMFYALVFADGIGLLATCIIAISFTAVPVDSVYTALHYLMYSIFSSLIGYVGCFLVYTCTNTLNINAIVILATTDGVSDIFLNNAFKLGLTFIVLKVAFLLGLFPFYLIVVEISSVVNHAYLFFFLVVSKFPVYIFFTKALKVIWAVGALAKGTLIAGSFKYLILLIGLISLIFGTFFIATVKSIKEFFAYSSMIQMGYVLMLTTHPDFISIYTAALFYISYCLASAGLFLFLCTSRIYTSTEKDGDIETWVDLKHFLTDSYKLVKMRSEMGASDASKNASFLSSAACAVVAIVTLAGFPFLSGFFLKLNFIEIFLHRHMYSTLVVILVSSMITAYAYFNMLSLAAGPEIKKPDTADDSNNNAYDQRLSIASKADAVFSFILTATMVAVTVVGANMKWFWWFVDLTRSFFYDHFLYVFAINDNSGGIKYGLVFFTFLSSRSTILRLKNYWLTRLKRYSLRVRRFARYLERTPFWVLYEDLKAYNSTVRFYKNSYKDEFILVLTINAVLLVLSHTLWYKGVTSSDSVFFWSRCFHHVFVNFFCWALFYNISYSVIVYRAAFVFYLLISFFVSGPALMFMWIEWHWYPLAVESFWTGWCAMSYETFPQALIAAWQASYHVFWGTAIWVFIFTYGYTILKAYSDLKNPSTANLRRHDGLANSGLTFENVVLLSIFDYSAYVFRFRKELYIIFVFFYVFGPGVQRMFLVDHNFVFFVKALLDSYLFWTADGFLTAFMFWSIFGTIVYSWLKDIESPSDLIRHNKEMGGVSLVERARDPIKLFNFGLFVALALVLPCFLASGVSPLVPIAAFYIKIVYAMQIAIYYWWHIAALLLVSYAIMRDVCGSRHFVLTVYYLSLTIVIFFFNQIVMYRNDPLCLAKSVGGVAKHSVLEPFSFGAYDYFGIAPDLFFTLPEGDVKPAFNFAYDYFSLILCFMTSLVFSFVFLTTLYNEKIERKKVFFFLLLLVECFTILTFLSSNFMGFVIFFESTLLPMALIVGYWGSSYKKWFASKMFFFYSLVSSLPATVSVVYLYRVFDGNLDYTNLLNNINLLTSNEQWALWAALFFMFAVKIPLFPVHSWLLHAHVEAPTAGSIVLASVMLKLGAFGFVRYSLGLMPQISEKCSVVVCAMALVSIFFSSVSSLAERDAKKLVAQTSISHMGLVVLGLFTFSEHGFFGAIYLIVGHSVTSTALFYLIGILYDRFHTRDLTSLGGLTTLMPLYCSGLFFFACANAGFPWALSFVGELNILVGVSRQWSLEVFLILLLCGVILLFSNLRLFISISFGTLNKDLISNATNDLTHLELFAVLYLVVTSISLMWGNDYFFHLMYYDAVWRHIFFR